MNKPLLSLQLQACLLMRGKQAAKVTLHQLINTISQIIYTKGKHIDRCVNTWEYNFHLGKVGTLRSGISKTLSRQLKCSVRQVWSLNSQNNEIWALDCFFSCHVIPTLLTGHDALLHPKPQELLPGHAQHKLHVNVLCSVEGFSSVTLFFFNR